MAIQQLNAELVDLLRAEFQARNEPNFAWKSAVSASLALPGLIASWPMSVVRLDNATDRARDVSGAGYHLSAINNVVFLNDGLVPYARFGGTNEYLSRADGGAANWADVRGNEAHIHATVRGMTMAGWFFTESIAAGQDGFMGKYDTTIGNHRSYLLRRNAATAQFYVSANGVAALGPAEYAISVDTWHFLAARYTSDGAAADITLWVDNNTDSVNIGAVPTLFDSNAAFAIGDYDSGAFPLLGRGSLCVLCQCAVSDAGIFSFFQQTRAMFGV